MHVHTLYNSNYIVRVCTAEVKLKPDAMKPYARGGPLVPSTYIMEQMHFHWSQDDYAGSEHHIKGHQ